MTCSPGVPNSPNPAGLSILFYMGPNIPGSGSTPTPGTAKPAAGAGSLRSSASLPKSRLTAGESVPFYFFFFFGFGLGNALDISRSIVGRYSNFDN